MPLTVFVDSDVVISSLLSSAGAAFLLLNQTDDLKLSISNLSQQELEGVAKRLEIPLNKLTTLITNRLHVTQLKHTIEQAREEYKKYVLDNDDAHIVLGGEQAKAPFLITYNLRHFKTEKIKQDCNSIVTTPGNLLQYLRSS